MSENSETFFGRDAVKPVKLPDWMEWASCKPNAPHNVVLPMIQRGSVWAPHKLLDLWDTLLRGMPVGALMASDVVGKPIQQLGASRTSAAKPGDIALIDGQQRTLSMLAGWPQGLKNSWRPVSIWVDLADKHQGEYQFRLWVTTKAQPFGYSRASSGGQPLSKLERKKLRLANRAWEKMEAQELWSQPDFMPWEAKFALPLPALVDIQLNKNGSLKDFILKRLASYSEALEGRMKKANNSQFTDSNLLEKENATTIELQKELAKHFADKFIALPTESKLTEQIPAIEVALNRVLACEFPIINVRQEIFDEKIIDDEERKEPDPPLAILFKRVGSSGVDLSNEDYVYAVIKHHNSKVHDMVDDLLKDARIRAIYTPTTLVMSAVRLTMLSLASDESNGQKLTDSARLDKAVFARMVRNHSGFIKEFENHIRPEGAFVVGLKKVLEHISYNNPDFTRGLPIQALCLVQIPLLETILAWHALSQPSNETLKDSRLAMVRFVLQGNLCVLDYAKASEVAIKALKEGTIAAPHIFPDQALMEKLCEGDKAAAYALPSPDELRTILVMPMEFSAEVQQDPDEPWRLTETRDGASGLRGWTRFVVVDQADKPHVEIYRRWCMSRKGSGHIHPMLLWLQRDYVFATFENEPALAGMDEETPFDFDHILPSAQWANWTGSNGRNRFMDFPIKDATGKILDKSGHWHIGNSIGNIHVLDSSMNRELGDMSVHLKLQIPNFAINALMNNEKQIADWSAASVSKENINDARHWEKERALSFQRAVEYRTFALYKKFYDDLM